MVRTKRGEAHKRIVRVGVEYGVQPSIHVYLNIWIPKAIQKNYLMTHIKMGGNPYYTNKQLEGYRNSSGVNDVLYPNIDYYNEFLLNQKYLPKRYN